MANREEIENAKILRFMNDTLSDEESSELDEREVPERDGDSRPIRLEDCVEDEEDYVERDYIEDTDETDADPDYSVNSSSESDDEYYPQPVGNRKRKRTRASNPPLPVDEELVDDPVAPDHVPPAATSSPLPVDEELVDDPVAPDHVPPAAASSPLPVDDPIAPDDGPHVAGNPPLPAAQHILYLGRPLVRAKNKHLWYTRQKRQNVRTPARNIVLNRRKVLGQAKNAISPRQCFFEMFDDDMLNKIVQHTNQEMDRIRINYNNHPVIKNPVTVNEMTAFIGLLVNTAFSKSNHLPTKELFDCQWSGNRFKSVMSANRFDLILCCLRFDDKATRLARKRNDPFAPIRELWAMFTSNCRTKYSPGSFVTVDEQLLAFRGKCRFRMYIPNKPAKYGIKIVMACDTNTSYMFDALPYVGKKTETRGMPSSEFFVKELTTSIHGTNRNVTTDNWFTGIKLAEDLLQPPYQLTLVGTIRLNRKGVPGKELKNRRDRPVNTSIFLFDNNKTLVSFKPKKNKVVTLLSTMHDNATVNQLSHKPEIIHCYNETKGAVDTLDQMSTNMSCSRKTQRWPLCVFFGMLNVCFVNAYIIYCLNSFSNGRTPKKRRDFMKDLCVELTDPHMRTRLQSTRLQKNLRMMITENLGLPAAINTNANNQVAPQGRKICYFCPSAIRRMTTSYCSQCHRAICGEHKALFCTECKEEI